MVKSALKSSKPLDHRVLFDGSGMILSDSTSLRPDEHIYFNIPQFFFAESAGSWDQTKTAQLRLPKLVVSVASLFTTYMNVTYPAVASNRSTRHELTRLS